MEQQIIMRLEGYREHAEENNFSEGTKTCCVLHGKIAPGGVALFDYTAMPRAL